jgi:hypothetical protein
MFDGAVPGVADLAGLDDAGLVDAIGAVTRAENAVCAVKVAAMAELFCRRTGLADAVERDHWWVDPQAAVTAEIGAAGGITQGLALSQTHRGVALRDRLPAVARLFQRGLVSDLVVRTIVWRTALVESPAAMARLDCELADRVTRWGALSEKKTEQAIDELVEDIDPGGLRRSRTGGCARGVVFGSRSDEPGFTTMWARVYSTDAVVIEQRVEEAAGTVCDGDPRSADERRADALAPAMTAAMLVCGCGQADCDGAAHQPPAKTAVVYVVADEKSVDAATAGQAQCPAPNEAASSGAGSCEPSNESASNEPAPDESTPDESEASEPSQCAAPPAFVFGAGVLPTALLGAIVDRALIREVRHPGADTAPEPRYTPSRAMCDFVRCRDLTCRFPGCDKPAQFCDLDHTVAYPVGPTHPSNLKCLCRFHHLLKTFWNGVRGWRDRQLPDGTIIWTSPTGHTYTTYPGSKHLFPTLCEPTATLWAGEPPTVESRDDRGVMMPKRRHTRAHNTAKAIAAERRLNDTLVAELLTQRNKPPPF